MKFEVSVLLPKLVLNTTPNRLNILIYSIKYNIQSSELVSLDSHQINLISNHHVLSLKYAFQNYSCLIKKISQKYHLTQCTNSFRPNTHAISKLNKICIELV